MSRLWAAKVQRQNAANLLNDSKITTCLPGASVFQAVKWEQMWQSDIRIAPLLPKGKAIPEKITLESSSTLAPLLLLLLLLLPAPSRAS